MSEREKGTGYFLGPEKQPVPFFGAGRWLFGSEKKLKMTAKVLGAASVGTLFTGMIAKDPHPQLPAGVRRKIKSLAGKLV